MVLESFRVTKQTQHLPTAKCMYQDPKIIQDIRFDTEYLNSVGYQVLLAVYCCSTLNIKYF